MTARPALGDHRALEQTTLAPTALGEVRPSGFRLPQALYPVNLSEFESFPEAERNHHFSPLDPLIRLLTGAEEVHLASCRAGGSRPS